MSDPELKWTLEEIRKYQPRFADTLAETKGLKPGTARALLSMVKKAPELDISLHDLSITLETGLKSGAFPSDSLPEMASKLGQFFSYRTNTPRQISEAQMALLTGLARGTFNHKTLPLIVPAMRAHTKAGHDLHCLLKSLHKGLKAGNFKPEHLPESAEHLRRIIEASPSSLATYLDDKAVNDETLPLMAPSLIAHAKEGHRPGRLMEYLSDGIKSGKMTKETLPDSAELVRKGLEELAKSGKEPKKLGLPSVMFGPDGFTYREMSSIMPSLVAHAKAGHDTYTFLELMKHARSSRKFRYETLADSAEHIRKTLEGYEDPHKAHYALSAGMRDGVITHRTLPLMRPAILEARALDPDGDSGLVDHLAERGKRGFINEEVMAHLVPYIHAHPPLDLLEHSIDAAEKGVPLGDLVERQKELLDRGVFPDSDLVATMHDLTKRGVLTAKDKALLLGHIASHKATHADAANLALHAMRAKEQLGIPLSRVLAYQEEFQRRNQFPTSNLMARYHNEVKEPSVGLRVKRWLAKTRRKRIEKREKKKG